MAIKLNDILNLSDKGINNSRIELNMRDVITGENISKDGLPWLKRKK